MKNIVQQIHTLLIKNKQTIAVAESCTGGLVSSLLSRTPGSSQYFIIGIITYSNTAKISFLKIPSSVVVQKGAVSKETAVLMAKQIKKLAKTDLGIGITGIAGPGGGSIQKPVGTVFVALFAKEKLISKKFIFKGSRLAIRKKAAQKSLELLKTLIK